MGFMTVPLGAQGIRGWAPVSTKKKEKVTERQPVTRVQFLVEKNERERLKSGSLLFLLLSLSSSNL